MEKCKKKKRIVHIVHRDKFTTDYINFMHDIMNEYEHNFLILSRGFDLRKLDTRNVIYMDSYKSLLFDNEVKKLLKEGNQIIVSGVFGMVEHMFFLPKSILKKTYYQFWGGDFYSYRNCEKIKSKITKYMLYKNIKRCAGVINLVENDYEKLSSIFLINKKHFVAPVPGDPNEQIDYAGYREKSDKSDKIRILVGNSSTKENQHLEAFRLLEKFKDKNIEIVCPLSYGDMKYRDLVLEEGTKIFGTKFCPILDYKSKEEYVELLSSCNIGIFNNNRQQALGNIIILLRLGKKVYERTDTSMWEYHKKWGVVCYDVSEIESIDYEKFIEYDEIVKTKNIEITEENRMPKFKKQWEKVFCDNCY